MSANNCYIILKHKGMYYGWDEMAEAELGEAKRFLSASKAAYTGKTARTVLKQLEQNTAFPEYGVVTELNKRLPKDGTPVEVVD